jgi:hypothetical protein
MGIFNMWFKRDFKTKKIEKTIVSEIVYNGLRTPDGTVIESTNRHDYRTHIDNTNNKIYAIDGGHEYIRRSSHGDEKLITITSDMPHDIIRLYAFRTGYGNPKSKDYGKNKQLTRICYMDDEYLENSIIYVSKNFRIIGTEHMTHLNILLDEQIYRIKNNVITLPISLSEILN